MDALITSSDIMLLRQAGLSPEDQAHSVQVAEIALAVARTLEPALDPAVLARGALFHDLGKAVRTDILHGLEGTRLGRKLGLPEAVLEVARKHVRCGVPPEEAAGYGLPPGDYRLASLEEKVAVYADKLSDILEEPGLARDLADARRRFADILAVVRPDLAKDGPTRDRYLALHRELEALARPESLSPAQLRAEHLSPAPPRILDVRRPADRDADPTALPGSVWRDPAQVQAWLAECKPGEQAVVYCARGGQVSREVARALAGAGVAVRFLEGGLAAWKAEETP